MVQIGLQSIIIDWGNPSSALEAIKDQKFDSTVITIPPGSREAGQSIALHESIVRFAIQIQTIHTIYCSSTSIYGDARGIVEEKDAQPESLIGQLESLYVSNWPQVAILRFGGLIGADRNPVSLLAKKNVFEKPLAAVNLTTLDDALGALEVVLNGRLTGTFNAVNTDHPGRYEFYSRQASKCGLKLPIADTRDIDQGKEVSSALFSERTGYTFEPLENQGF